MYDHLRQYQELVDETSELFETVANSVVRCHRKSGVPDYEVLIDHPDADELRENLEFLYHDCGIGFKLLCKMLGNTTYVRLRTAFEKLGIEKRTGQSVVTSSLQTLRSENAKKKGTFKNWTEKYTDKDFNVKQYKGGWYWNASQGKDVWLRSSWEYAYATWLDANGATWDVEVRNFLLSDGVIYRPDFFIFENNCLMKIVEIKAKWYHGSEVGFAKFERFKQEYPDIASEIISSEIFELVGRRMGDVLKEWKQVRRKEKREQADV